VAKPPNIRIRGRSQPSGYVVGRSAPGRGDPQLVDMLMLGAQLNATGVPSVSNGSVPLSAIANQRLLGNGSGASALPVALSVTMPAAGITLAWAAGGVTYALADDLAGVEGLSTTGLAARTAASTWATRTLTAPAAGFTVTNPAGIAGDPTFVLANDLAALEGLGSTGIAVRTTTDTWAQRTLQPPAAGITITNPAGVAGDPTFVLANDLAGVEGLSTTGLAARTAASTWTTRTITPPAAGISIANGDGVAGDPTLSLANDLLAVEGLAGTGVAVRTAASTWTTRTITGTASKITVSDGDGVAGNPTLTIPDAVIFVSPTLGNATATTISVVPATAGALAIGASYLIGGVSPVYTITSVNGTSQARFTANVNAPIMRFGKSRGSTTVAAAIAAGDRPGEISFYGDDGSTNGDITVNSAILRVQAIGAVSTGIVPAFFALHTMNAAGVLAERARFSAEGGLDLGGTSEPGSGNLNVTGTAAVGGNATVTGTVTGTATGSLLPDQIFDHDIICSTQFDKTSNTTLGNITMSSNQVLVAGKTYIVKGWFSITAGAAGGLKMALASAAITVTSMRLNAIAFNGTTAVSNTTVTALTSNFVAFTGVVTDVYIEGSIVVNVGGTLRIQMAQNVSDATTTSVLTGSTFAVRRIN